MSGMIGSVLKFPGRILVMISALWLAACDPVPTTGGGPRIDTNDPIPVALLVPGGSGQAADDALAMSLENAARLAMADLDGVEIDLRVYQTAGSAAQAATVADQAVTEGARILLGPVYAGSASAAGTAVAARGINVLAFSNNTAIAGGNVYVLGNTFQNTANRLVRYASGQGRGNILIVHGQDASEEAGRDAIASAIAASGGVPAGARIYHGTQRIMVAINRHHFHCHRLLRL